MEVKTPATITLTEKQKKQLETIKNGTHSAQHLIQRATIDNVLAQKFNTLSLLRFAFPTIAMMIFMGLYTIGDTGVSGPRP